MQTNRILKYQYLLFLKIQVKEISSTFHWEYKIAFGLTINRHLYEMVSINFIGSTISGDVALLCDILTSLDYISLSATFQATKRLFIPRSESICRAVLSQTFGMRTT